MLTSTVTSEKAEVEKEDLVGLETYYLLKMLGYAYDRPTQSLAQRFIRREFKLNIEVLADRDVEDSFYYAVSRLGGGYVTNILDATNNSSTYEKALEAGLRKAITHIKERRL
jgi:hypothetical protein